MVSFIVFTLRTAHVAQLLYWVICHKDALLGVHLAFELIFVRVGLFEIGVRETSMLELVLEL